MHVSRVVVCAGLFLAPFSALGTETWMSVMLDGQKVGKLHVERKVGEGTITTDQALDFRFTRVKTPITTHTDVRMVESAVGKPLGFSSSGGQGSEANDVDGEPHGPDAFQISTTINDQSKVSVLTWPEGALMAEGQRLAIVSHGFRAGTTYRLRQFEPSRQQVADVDVTVVGDERVGLPSGVETLHHLRQVLAGSNGTQSTDTWVDDQGFIRRSIAPLMGFRLEMAACDEACALAPDQDVDMLRAAMVASPRLLPGALRTTPMQYTVQVRGNHPVPFVDTDEQRIEDLGNGLYQINIGFPFAHGDEAGPMKEDISPNPWVQSDAPAIRDAAKAIVGDASSDMARMRSLRSYLTDHIDTTGLSIGYASALETLQTHRGDCTEHAVLLTALARSLGIPARVVTGLVYADRFGGTNRVFIPHAWVQAWLKDRWVSFDSAQGRYDTTHIALGVGDGDPWRFFAATAVLGSIDIRRAVPAAHMMDAPPGMQNDLMRDHPGPQGVQPQVTNGGR